MTEKRNRPYVSLGSYHPSVAPWRAWRIGGELVKLTQSSGLLPHKDPAHGPEPHASWVSNLMHAQVRRFNLNGPGGSWHYDGDDTPGANPNCWLVLWTDRDPTLVKWADQSTVYQPQPFEVIMFDNMRTRHRRPDDVPYARWSFRQRIKPPTKRQLLAVGYPG